MLGRVPPLGIGLIARDDNLLLEIFALWLKEIESLLDMSGDGSCDLDSLSDGFRFGIGSV